MWAKSAEFYKWEKTLSQVHKWLVGVRCARGKQSTFKGWLFVQPQWSKNVHINWSQQSFHWWSKVNFRLNHLPYSNKKKKNQGPYFKWTSRFWMKPFTLFSLFHSWRISVNYYDTTKTPQRHHLNGVWLLIVGLSSLTAYVLSCEHCRDFFF